MSQQSSTSGLALRARSVVSIPFVEQMRALSKAEGDQLAASRAAILAYRSAARVGKFRNLRDGRERRHRKLQG